MKQLIVLVIVFTGTSSFAKEASLVLSGVVPLAAEVVIQKDNQIIYKSSAGLKTRIQKRSLASVIQVTAP